MLFLFKGLGFLLGTYPLYRAWQANRSTSLVHAIRWAVAAWLFWGLAGWTEGHVPETRYAALCVTGCAAVAVLGARRPGAGPWNFVVAGLLAVLLLPFAESWVTGKPFVLDTARGLFLGATLAVGIVNYLPTRFAGAAILLALGCVLEVVVLTAPNHDVSVWFLNQPGLTLWPCLVSLAAYGLARSRVESAAEFDQLWLDFRDRFGFVWGQRLREQFNNAARHASWPVILRWQGLRLLPGSALPESSVQDEILDTLRALMKRFGPEDGSPSARC